MNYEIEPLMGEQLIENLKKYNEGTYAIHEEDIKQLAKLIEDYGMYICTDKSEDFALKQHNVERLIELSIKLNLSLSSAPAMYESEYRHMKSHWYPDWEICNGCHKRFTYECKPEYCNPLDI